MVEIFLPDSLCLLEMTEETESWIYSYEYPFHRESMTAEPPGSGLCDGMETNESVTEWFSQRIRLDK